MVEAFRTTLWHYPLLLALPSSIGYFLFKVLNFQESKELRLLLFSLPGVLLLILSLTEPVMTFQSLLLGSVLLVPTNLLCPVFSAYASIAYIRNRTKSNLSIEFRTIDKAILAILIVAYCYDLAVFQGLTELAP